jgi:hypothetical protein
MSMDKKRMRINFFMGAHKCEKLDRPVLDNPKFVDNCRYLGTPMSVNAYR